MALIVGCGSSKSDDELVVYFVPSRDSKEIQSATQPLADMLKEEELQVLEHLQVF